MCGKPICHVSTEGWILENSSKCFGKGKSTNNSRRIEVLDEVRIYLVNEGGKAVDVVVGGS